MSGHRFGADWQKAPSKKKDPGDAANIVHDSGLRYISFDTGASGETGTLKDPTSDSSLLILHCKNHGGGDRVITADSAVNQTGNNTLTFGADDDLIVLASVEDKTSGYRWQVVENDGVGLSTV